jgi:hypothetical protein
VRTVPLAIGESQHTADENQSIITDIISQNTVVRLTAGVELVRVIVGLDVCLTLAFAICLPRSRRMEPAALSRTTTAGSALEVALVIAVCLNSSLHLRKMI